MDKKDKRLIEDASIEHLKAIGYTVEDLNDNPHGLRVRGPSWKVTAPDGTHIAYEWIAVDAWVSARQHADRPPALPDQEAS